MVPVGTTLRVHSVFTRAVNLEGAPGGYLVSLVVHPRDMAATAVLVDSLINAPDPGQRAMITEPGAGGDPSRWQGRLPADPPAIAIASLCALLERLVADYGCDGGMLPLVSAAADTPVTRFARAALQGSGRPDWSRLVGLGIGLTPSGDDFLTGALLAESLLVAACARPHYAGARRADAAGAASDGVSVDRANLSARLGGTTAAGRTLLAAALEERFPAYLLNLVETATADGALTADHLAHGHSSATDSVCGIIVRLRMGL